MEIFDEPLLLAQLPDLPVELGQPDRERAGQLGAPRAEQLPDHVERQAGPPVPPDPGEAVGVGPAVAPVSGGRPRRRREHPDPVVVEQGAPGQPMPASQLPDAQDTVAVAVAVAAVEATAVAGAPVEAAGEAVSIVPVRR